MLQTRGFFEKMLAELEETLQKANEEIEDCPIGTLMQEKRGERTIFFQVNKTEGKRTRKVITKEVGLIQGLERRAYLEQERAVLETDIKAVRSLARTYRTPYYEDIMELLPARLRSLPPMYTSLDELSVWAAEPYRQSTYKPERKVHTTSRGLKVRSKSELLIAEKMYELNVPFRYEQVLTIGEIDFAPDFTILKNDGKIVYWEHCGLTGNAKYMNRHKWKMSVYEEAGIVPWKNLIVTYDDEYGFLDMVIVENEIRNKLI